MKKTHYYFKTRLWLVLSLLLFGSAVQLSAQNMWDTSVTTENFQTMTAATPSGNCPANGATNVTNLRLWSGWTGGMCSGTYTLAVPSGGWVATNIGATEQSAPTPSGRPWSIGISRQTGILILPTVENVEKIVFYIASRDDGSSLVTNAGRGIAFLINGVAQTDLSGTIFIGAEGNAVPITSTSRPGYSTGAGLFQFNSSWTRVEIRPGTTGAVTFEMRGGSNGNNASDNAVADFSIVYNTPSCSILPTASFVDGMTVDKLTTDPDFTNVLNSNNTSAQAWTSNDNTVATVNPTTGEVSIQGAGTASIRVQQAIDGDICAVDLSYTLNVSTVACTGTDLGVSTALTPSAPTDSRFTATWTAVANAATYTVRAYQGTNLIQTIPNITGTGTNITGLLPSTVYTFTVQAIGDGVNFCNGQESAPSASITTLPPPSPIACSSDMIPLFSTDFANWDSRSGGSSGDWVALTGGNSAGFQAQGGINVNNGEIGVRTSSSNRALRFPPFNFIAGGTVTVEVDQVTTTSRNISLSHGATPANIAVPAIGYYTFTLPPSVTGEQSLTLTFSNTGFRINRISVCSGVGTAPYILSDYQDLTQYPKRRYIYVKHASTVYKKKWRFHHSFLTSIKSSTANPVSCTHPTTTRDVCRVVVHVSAEVNRTDVNSKCSRRWQGFCITVGSIPLRFIPST